jgi:hypothetical protein
LAIAAAENGIVQATPRATLIALCTETQTAVPGLYVIAILPTFKDVVAAKDWVSRINKLETFGHSTANAPVGFPSLYKVN